jgi:hypothetical protein
MRNVKEEEKIKGESKDTTKSRRERFGRRETERNKHIFCFMLSVHLCFAEAVIPECASCCP